ISLITRNDAIKLFQLLSLAYWNTQFFHFECASVGNHISPGFSFGVIAGEAEVGVHRGRQVIHLITCRQRDFERVTVLNGTFKFDRELARFFGFENGATLHPQHSWPYQEKIAGSFGVIARYKRVIETERQVGLSQIL